MMTPQQQIEYSILQAMVDGTPNGYDGWFFPFRWIKSHVGLDIEIIRGFMKSMRNRQLVEYGHGFDEDGMVSGSGYSLTQQGRLHFKELAPLSALAKCNVRQEDLSSWATCDGSYQ